MQSYFQPVHGMIPEVFIKSRPEYQAGFSTKVDISLVCANLQNFCAYFSERKLKLDRWLYTAICMAVDYTSNQPKKSEASQL